ncbi:MAG: lysophospholipid acyltransferase family protein [Negativicutes bacterium]|nr:lysophospholipid acyltransferase family protein [Negativicutes bacterium]
MVYRILQPLVKLFLLLFFRLKSSGQEHLPSGGCVIASNHMSLLDPPVIGCSLPVSRGIHFMAKQELFKIPIFSWIIAHLGAFPVRRGMSDRNAIRTAIDLLRSGEIVGMFPEGTRSSTGQLGKALPGMAMLAVKAGVPVVPAAIVGTDKAFSRGCLFPAVTARFGPPIILPAGRTERENIEFLTNTIMEEIARLLEQEGG